MWAQQQQQQQQQHAGLVLLGCVLLRLQLSYVTASQLQSCIDGFVVHKDKIIRTEDSLKLGAVYLSEYEVGSRLDCVKWCCQTDNCDVFVFEDRKPAGCYLFHCGPAHDFKCKFTNHVNYSSAVLTDYNLLQSADAIDELKSLRKSEAALRQRPAATTSTSITTSTTTTTTTSPAPPSSSSSELIKPAVGCSRNQFECRSSDDCIAIYNVCDGIPQCADGSDEALELQCPQERTTAEPAAPPPPPPQLQHPRPHQADQLGYQRIMQHQYPVRMYPAESVNQENADKAWSNYQSRGYAAQQQQRQQVPPNEPSIGSVEASLMAQQHRSQQPLPNYNQWRAPAEQPVAGPWPLELDEQKALAPASHDAPIATQQQQQQQQHAFQHKPAGLRLEQMQSANGLYAAQQPDRAAYAAYYPAVVRPAEAASTWQEGAPPPGPTEQRQQQVPALPTDTAAQPKLDSSAAPPACDSAENRQRQQQQQPVPQQQPVDGMQSRGGAISAEHALHKGHELQLKTLAQAHLQQHKSIAIVDRLARDRQLGPRIDELDMARPRGALISLALGISVTAIMAVLIVCRLRVVKRRGRGRSHDSYAHDTDYLVNGMYL